jgi:hypothetical protein
MIDYADKLVPPGPGSIGDESADAALDLVPADGPGDTIAVLTLDLTPIGDDASHDVPPLVVSIELTELDLIRLIGRAARLIREGEHRA